MQDKSSNGLTHRVQRDIHTSTCEPSDNVDDQVRYRIKSMQHAQSLKHSAVGMSQNPSESLVCMHRYVCTSMELATTIKIARACT